MIHEPVVYDEGPESDPRYRVDWGGVTPGPNDSVHMSVELFERCIGILNGAPR